MLHRPVSRRRASVLALALGIALILGACGQPMPGGAGGAATAGTAVPAPPTPSPILTTPQVAATQTAFAAIPTKSDLSPYAPTIEATLAIPTPTREIGTQVRPTVPIPTVPTLDPGQPCIRGYGAASPGLRIQVPSSGLIIVGTVTQILPARWSTADGQRPPNPCGVTEPPFPYIYTPVRVAVEHVLKGSVSATAIEFRMVGGTVGQDRMIVSNETPVVVGQRSVIFANPSDGPGISGRYIINPDGTATEAIPPMRNVPLQQLLDEIAALASAVFPTPNILPPPSSIPATPSAGP